MIKYQNREIIVPQIGDRVRSYDAIEHRQVMGTITSIRPEDVGVDWDENGTTYEEALWYVFRDPNIKIARYKESGVVPQIGDIVEPYDHFYQGTVVEIINAHFVRVDWRRWATEKHVEVEFPPQIYFVRREE